MAKITVYSTEQCPWCHTLKDFLKDKSVEFEAKDVAVDEAARAELLKKSGGMGVPVIDIDGLIIVGFDQEAIEKALGL